MIRRNTWIVLGMFVLVLAAGYYFQFGGGAGAAEATPTVSSTASENVFEGVDATSVSSFRIEDMTGRVLQMERNPEGAWNVSEPAGGTTNVTEAETAVDEVISLRTLAPLNPMDDLGVYGLTNPAATITLSMNDGNEHVLLVGDKAPTGNGYYVKVDQNLPKIVNSSSVDSILGYLDNPPLEPTPTVEIETTPEIEGTVTPQP